MHERLSWFDEQASFVFLVWDGEHVIDQDAQHNQETEHEFPQSGCVSGGR
jgi:hypothetical protein